MSTSSARHPYLRLSLSACVLAGIIAGCGGGSVGDAAPTPTYAISGKLEGLQDGNAVTLANNENDMLTLRQDGPFAFPALVDGTYAVAVASQPLWQKCVVSNGTGIATADVKSVQVSCDEIPAQVGTLAGSGMPGTVDGIGPAASFSVPAGVAADAAGALYVTDFDSGLLRRVTPSGKVTTVAAGLERPVGVAVGSNGTIYVAESGGNRISVVTPTGRVDVFAGNGNAGTVDGKGMAASFNTPFGLAVDKAGFLYVAEGGGHTIRRVSPSADVTTFAGSGLAGFADGTGPAASFNIPFGLSVAADGTVYVADSSNNRIRKISPAGEVSTFAGSGAEDSADGSGTAAAFSGPYDVAISDDGALFIAEARGNKVRRISPAGAVTTLAGSGAPGRADGPGAAAKFDGPVGVAFGAGRVLYVTDSNNNLVRAIGR